MGRASSLSCLIFFFFVIWGQSPRNESSVALGSIVAIAMYSVYVLKIDPPTTFKIFPKIDSLMSCSLCPQSLGHENISF